MKCLINQVYENPVVLVESLVFAVNSVCIKFLNLFGIDSHIFWFRS